MKSVFWMMGTLISFCFMAIAVRELSADIDTFQILFKHSSHIAEIDMTRVLNSKVEKVSMSFEYVPP